MENQRVFLWIALALVAWLTWQAWINDYHRPAEPAQPQSTAAEQGRQSGADLPSLPDGATDNDKPALPEMEAPPPAGKRIRVSTDVLELELTTDGGDLVSAVLKDYPVRKDRPDVLVQLLDDSPSNLFVFRTGLRAAGGGPEPNHQAQYEAAEDQYVLSSGQDVLEIPLVWRSGNGLTVTKTYSLERGSYRIGIRYSVENRSGSEWRGASYVQLRRRHVPLERSFVDVDTYSYRGPVVYDGEKYEKLDVDDLPEEPMERKVIGGWIASIQHHFLAAGIPPTDRASVISARMRDGIYTLTAVGEINNVAAGSASEFEEILFVGPKLQQQLRETAPGLRLTVDYGFLTIISQPLFWVLQKLHNLTGNWGWAIILLTVLIKLVFYKLSETSGKSMAKMRKLQPRLKALQERYKDDRQALSQAMMEMYKREKVNPASGCLPILVQMPVFLALYWVLLESVELRQAPFMLWINDLSSRDPYYILPLLMGVTMFIQQRLNPAPPDPIQAKVMMTLPIVFTVFFAFFPAGLVLYWFVNNLLSIAQQWRINKVVERGN
ncbi:MAG: membrane protein insertase YidC [Gammaproteobacteria bacterium]|jgi:YidC/Oxa1 family membrane protein insertase